MARTVAIIVALLASSAVAVRRGQRARQVSGSSPFTQDCWKKVPMRTSARARAIGLSLSALNSSTSKASLPGAGLDEVKPFETVLKDGFLPLECAKDYLFVHGDKFGDGKDSYKLGEITNVSIVHYTDIILKEDREEMTHEVCFAFCRTVPDMLIFGITNGRDCYCSPYFTRMESDSTDCDEVCDGDKSQTCGGKVKSSIFEMHSCDDTEGKLKAAAKVAEDASKALGKAIKAVETASESLQKSAETAQKSLGEAGDPEAADLMQTAKVWAGDLEAAATSSAPLKKGMDAAVKKAAALTVDATKFGDVSKAEALEAAMGKMSEDAKSKATELGKLSVLATPEESNFSKASAAQYSSIMYFVDKDRVKDPTTCTGTPVAKPITDVTLDECAHACDSHIHECVGFSYYDGLEPNLCFLFSKFTEVKYWTECTTSALIQRLRKQRKQDPGFSASDFITPMTCMAKLSKFEGTDLTPNVKSDLALKKLVKAARCPSIAMA